MKFLWGSRGKLIMKFFINDFFMLENEAKKNLMFVSLKVLLFIQNVNLFSNLFLNFEKMKFYEACMHSMTSMYEENSNELVNFL